MSNSVRILCFVVITFLIYITAKGKLPTYAGFFKLGNSVGETNGAASVAAYGTTEKTLTQQATDAATALKTGAKIAQTAESAFQSVTAANGVENKAGDDEIAAALEAVAASQVL